MIQKQPSPGAQSGKACQISVLIRLGAQRNDAWRGYPHAPRWCHRPHAGRPPVDLNAQGPCGVGVLKATGIEPTALGKRTPEP